MTILKKLRQAAFKQTVILLILGVILTGLGVLAAISPDEPPTAMNDLALNDLNEDQFVSISKFYYLGEYASVDAGDHTDWYSVIGIENANGDAYLLTLKITEEEGKRLGGLVDPDPEAIPLVDHQNYHGRLKTLPSDAKVFYDEALDVIGSGSAVNYSDLYLEGTPGLYEVDNTGNLIIGFVFIVMGLLLSVLPLLVLFGVMQGKAHKAAALLSGSGSARFYLEDFDAKAVEVNGVYFTDEAILFNQGYITHLLPLKDLVWAFRREVDQRLYFIIRIATYHFITMMTPDKKKHKLVFRKQAQMETVMSALKERCPELVVTKYDRQLEKLFKEDPSSFKAAVAEISSRLKAQAEASKE